MERDPKTVQLHIFDVDGTILDSMPMWRGLPLEYLALKGKTGPKDLHITLSKFTMDRAAEYLRANFGLSESAGQIKREITELIARRYADDIGPLEPGFGMVKELRGRGARVVALSTSDKGCIASAFARLGILGCFEDIYTAADFGLPKSDPEIFRLACRRCGVAPENAVVYEDSPYAMEAAAAAGCAVVDVRALP